MDLQLTGKKAIVTGASRGIGRAIARQLALEGCDIAICARTEEPLKDAAAALAKESGRKVVPIVCDTLNAEAIKHFVTTAARELVSRFVEAEQQPALPLLLEVLELEAEERRDHRTTRLRRTVLNAMCNFPQKS